MKWGSIVEFISYFHCDWSFSQFFCINIFILCDILLWRDVIMNETRHSSTHTHIHSLYSFTFTRWEDCDCNQLLWRLNGRWICLCRSQHLMRCASLLFVISADCLFSSIHFIMSCWMRWNGVQVRRKWYEICHRKLYFARCKCWGKNVWFCRLDWCFMWAHKMLIK